MHAVGIYKGDRTEVGYYLITDEGTFCTCPEIISGEDLIPSLYPKIALNDNRTFYTIWNDTGNVIFRRGSYDENGDLIWDPQIVVSNDRYAVFPDIAVSETFVSVVWDNHDGENRTILTRHSNDGSSTFCSDDTPTVSVRAGEPSIELFRNRLHIVWSEEISEKGEIFYRQGILPEIRKEDNRPKSYDLKQNYPNPANGNTHIEYDLQFPGHVTLILYNILGQKKSSVVDEFQEVNTYKKSFDVNQFSSGVYFYQLRTGYFTATKKSVIIR